jgi:hypothetical protein
MMDPFVVERLLTKTPGGGVAPTPSAPDVKIDLALHDLDEDDKAYGLHTIRFLLTSLDAYCRDLEHTLILTSAELLDPDVVEFVDDLATLVKVRAKKL